MPAQAEWIHRLPEIRAELQGLAIPVVDRAIIERVFRLKRRRAIQLLHRFGGYQAGRTFLIDRSVLLQQLETSAGPDCCSEQRRRKRLAENLDELRRHRAAAAVSVRVDPDIVNARIGRLSEGIHLGPGMLKIEFANLQELMTRLFELSQAMANDFERLSEFIRSK
jgi:hypothetical protein